jgi:thymidylate synthase (FAD)
MIKTTYVGHMGTDLTVVNAARVSFNKSSMWVFANETYPSLLGRKLSDKDAKLLKYLAEHGHYSPFGHCFLSLHVKAPVFVARQLVKHKFLRWNEVSRRYVDEEPEFYTPEVWRGRSEDKKQGSSGEVTLYEDEPVRQAYYPFELVGLAKETYDYLLDQGVCPEQARMVLPQSLMTEWYWSGSLDAFTNMLNLRLKEDTQYETRLVAQQVHKIAESLFPVSVKELVNV